MMPSKATPSSYEMKANHADLHFECDWNESMTYKGFLKFIHQQQRKSLKSDDAFYEDIVYVFDISDTEKYCGRFLFIPKVAEDIIFTVRKAFAEDAVILKG